MRKRVLTLFFAILIIVCMVIIPTVSASASSFDGSYIKPLDFGDQNDYGGGGGYDYGGGNDYDFGNSNDDNYSYGTTSSSDDSDFTFTDILVAVAVFAVISVAVYFLNKNKGKKSTSAPPVASPIVLPDRTAQIGELIKQGDEQFSPDNFVSFAKFVYITIQDAWSKRDLSPVRLYLHDNLYNQTELQVKAKIERGITPHCENVAVNTAYMSGYKRDKSFEYITVYLTSHLTDYETDATGNVVRGNPSERYAMKYALRFVRNRGVKTNDNNADLIAHNCPNCGAVLEMSSSGKCEYCDSVITTGEYTWVLCDYASIRNDTPDEGIITED